MCVCRRGRGVGRSVPLTHRSDDWLDSCNARFRDLPRTVAEAASRLARGSHKATRAALGQTLAVSNTMARARQRARCVAVGSLSHPSRLLSVLPLLLSSRLVSLTFFSVTHFLPVLVPHPSTSINFMCISPSACKRTAVPLPRQGPVPRWQQLQVLARRRCPAGPAGPEQRGCGRACGSHWPARALPFRTLNSPPRAPL